MRTFVALRLPKNIKEELAKTQKELAKTGLQAKWVKPESTHLTIAFLGLIDPVKIKTIGQVIEKASRSVKPIKLQLLKTGGFPSPAKARVVFVGLGGELGKLHALVLKIQKSLKKEKIWFDQKPFRAHLTLGRIKKNENLAEVIEKVKVKPIKFNADEVLLVKSQLTATGPIYTNLSVHNFKSGRATRSNRSKSS